MPWPNADDREGGQYAPRDFGGSQPRNPRYRAHLRRRARFLAGTRIAVFSLCCLGLGYALSTLQQLGNDRRALPWALSSEGERARRLADSGALRALEACAIPSQGLSSTCCFVLPALSVGEAWAFCASPIR
jgi:hypothetical protein